MYTSEYYNKITELRINYYELVQNKQRIILFNANYQDATTNDDSKDLIIDKNNEEQCRKKAKKT